MKIGYCGDGPWAHQAFEKIIQDKSFKIVFVTVRYDKQDAKLMQLAREHNIPIELSQNINSQEFLNRIKNIKWIFLFLCLLIRFLKKI